MFSCERGSPVNFEPQAPSPERGTHLRLLEDERDGLPPFFLSLDSRVLPRNLPMSRIGSDPAYIKTYSVSNFQGYLAHKKQRPPRWGGQRVLGARY